jgi:hypothetical protein
MKRVIIFLGILCMFFVSSYSYTNISSCGQINSPGEYRLNDSLSNYTHALDWCIILNVNDIQFDCQYNTISARQPFFLNNQNNSLYNCIIENTSGYGIDIVGVSKGFIENITFKNISQIRLNGVNNFNLSNLVYLNSIGNNNINVNGVSVNNLKFDNLVNFDISFDPTTSGPNDVEIINSNLGNVAFATSDGEAAFDFNISNNNISILTFFGNVSNFLISNNEILTTSFLTFGTEYPINNNFSNNILHNLTSVSWVQTPQFFSSNFYDSFLVNSSGCIVGSSYCDSLFSLIVAPLVVSGAVSVTSLPSFGVISMFISLLLVFGGLSV